jgi:CRP/FNR family cyclic AMP-dependent transcriptional regulator
MTRIPKQVLEMLAAVPLFSSCSKSELRAIASLGTTVPEPDGKVLTEQGQLGLEFCLLLSGKTRCLIDGELVATLGPGDWFGEMALLDRGPRHATVIADGPVELLVLNAAEFNDLLDVSPSIAKKLLVSFATRERLNASLHH